MDELPKIISQLPSNPTDHYILNLAFVTMLVVGALVGGALFMVSRRKKNGETGSHGQVPVDRFEDFQATMTQQYESADVVRREVREDLRILSGKIDAVSEALQDHAKEDAKVQNETMAALIRIEGKL